MTCVTSSSRCRNIAGMLGCAFLRSTIALLCAYQVSGVAVRGGSLACVIENAKRWNVGIQSGDNGSGFRQLPVSDVDQRSPVLAWDRQRLAYSESDGSLWIRDLTTGSTRRLTAGFWGHPSWMPNG